MTKQLTLFSVTLNWGDPGSDEGDYATWVWAEDDEQAIRLVAEEMADSGEKTFDTDAERDEYIKALAATAGPSAAQKVSARVFPEIEMLMKGPAGELTADAERDFASIKALIAKYGDSREQTYRNIFSEALEAKFISTSLSAVEDIRIRRDLVAQEVLGHYPSDMVITGEIYDADDQFGECLNWMNRAFEFPNWEGRTIGEFLQAYGIPGEPVCMNVIQHRAAQFNNDGIQAANITLQELWKAQPLGESGWLLPSGLEVWLHKVRPEA